MKLRILGCSGGIGGRASGTTAFLADDDILVDAGTGVGELELDELLRIDHVFVTHAHLDHIVSIPLLVDSVGELRDTPLTVYATAETIRILRLHVFNWQIWPDFTTIPDCHRPYLRFHPVEPGHPLRLGARTVTPLPARHSVPTVAYCLDSGEGKLVYTGDTEYSAELIAAINALDSVRHLIVETAFPESQHGLALMARHLCPSLLQAMLEELAGAPEVHITHLKPGQCERIMREIAAGAGRLRPVRLEQGTILEF
ncbi:MBL fold metallo-hydrolase [Aromatoleum buckelii]|uniref:MBL fold metallo-hydrolase n=1 Tax=Aromatoleum buckelii TaxID=200254 RepID=A0ABX1N2L7_9RHOO|nr:3',5'-cyclic-nucleotide phosphodiesterase [Aromatoleum buckelii]MCK0510679.1 3',5'-cyclic-nucleotide phosphodiesterase [Aromatoleum buckelii]